MAEKTVRVDEEADASADQAAVTTTVGAAVAATGATNSSPYGYVGAAQADAIVTNINTLRVDLLAINTALTAIRAALVANNIIKGGA